MILAEFWVPGEPRTKGSLERKGDHLTDSPRSKAWRRLVAERAYASFVARGMTALVRGAWIPFGGPVMVEIVSFSTHDVGDVDKLARNVLDAIACNRAGDRDNASAGIIKDDVQVVDSSSKRTQVRNGETPGQFVQVRTVDLAAFADGVRLRLTGGTLPPS